MRRKSLAILPLLLCCGCSTMNNTEAGLLGGGILGGAVGTLAGAAVGRPLEGAAIGAGAGAALGGISGASADRAEKREEIRQTAAVQAANQAAQDAALKAPRLTDIVAMTKNGVPEANIITQIRNAGAVYEISSDDIIYLTSNGVSSNVIAELQNTKNRGYYATSPPVVYAAPPPVVYVRPRYYYYDPPPVSVGIGFGGCRRW